MTTHLFLFTIGPVQSFIAQARKTQDLYAGSFLLSYLINSSMNQLKHRADYCEFLFPNVSLEHKPNRFVAKVGTEDIESLGQGLESFVRKKYEGIASDIFRTLGSGITAPTSFTSQIEDFLRVNWVALPLEEISYANTYVELEMFLGAIKNVRNFRALDEKGRKCLLCGLRNVLFYRGRRRAYTPSRAVSLHDQPLKFITDGESMCAICFTKRFAEKYFKNGYEKKYPSTAEIALMYPLKKVDSTLLDAYKAIFAKDFNYQLFYEENLTESYFEKNNIPLNKLEPAREYLSGISKNAKDNDVNLSKYYAIIAFDGDDMGEWVSGQFLQSNTLLQDFHGKLTNELGTFAAQAYETINLPKCSYKGRLVYAGGDDVLAFVNLNHLHSVLTELRKKFPKFETLSSISNGRASSASCGVCISHYKTPLSEALKWARKMEKEAKKITGKDALAIAVLKRSGEIRKTVSNWYYKDLSCIEILEKLTAVLSQKEFSNTFIKNLEKEFGLWAGESRFSDINSLFKTELERLIRRSCMLVKGDGESKDDFITRKKQAINDLVSKLKGLFTESKSLENFLFFLDITDFIAREVSQ